ncbi:3-isopropylmalate dehydratase large subunit [Paraburkholderia unamae]|uniref:3-isopropylmalate dehydratase large subunit n=1 Tax=Paraburkholderia unamae TaxID=219649 RepID=UPI000DC5086C|nr:3-isopropylmalate dehydratase large subunit [Paraburkholderia unamae]RAR56405.1 3-isopropylmalate dehydratase large subunit [Paraburkholderia unamae]
MMSAAMHAKPRTIIEKIWDAHAVAEFDSGQTLLHIDRVFLHDRAGPTVYAGLHAAGREMSNRELVFGTMDHIIDTHPGRGDETLLKGGINFIREFRAASLQRGVRLFDIGDARQGISHVVAPEQGIALPGSTLVCCDSHTCTNGGIGALAWGIGTSEGEHAVATQTLARSRPRMMRIDFKGRLQAGVTAKDLVLALIGKYGATGGAGHVIEFAGDAIRALDVEGRLTVCNMAVEFGAWTGLIAPDETTFEWLDGRPFAPYGASWDAAVRHWRTLHSDEGAQWDAELELDCSALSPQVTWGTDPGQVCAIDGVVTTSLSAEADRALVYMALRRGQPILGQPIDAAFIGSCTNSRLPDLRAAAQIVNGRKVAEGVKALVVPGSTEVKRQAEAEGLDRIFREAGFEWRESGCSLCFYAGGDNFDQQGIPARRVITSTNRNFEGRQGPGVRSHLASPATVAASAIAGCIADPRPLLS